MTTENKVFPDTYSRIETDELIRVYAAAPERLKKVVEDLSVKELQAHPKSGKWSIQEIVVHLSDAEIMGAARIRQTFAEPGSTFAVYDQAVWAQQFDYQNFDTKSFYSAMMLFDALRLTTTKIFKRAKETDWQKSGIHPEWGDMTLRQLLELYADHGERHIAQILELRKLQNNTLNFELLLKTRLY